MLRIYVTNDKQRQWLDHANGLLELGRGPQRGTARFRIEDIFVSRDQLRIREANDGRVCVENLSLKSPVLLMDGNCLAAGRPCELPLPLVLCVGKTRIKIETPAPEVSPRTKTLPPAVTPSTADFIARAVEQQAAVPATREERQAPAGQSAPPTAERMAQWLETVVSLQQAAVTSEFYQQTAQAMVELIGLDIGLILMRDAEGWQVAGCFPVEGGISGSFSHTLLNQVLAEKHTLYQDANNLPFRPESLTDIEAVVVSPIFGLNEEIVGVLYGSRNRGVIERGGILPLEAQLVQLLAATVAANLVRTAATRTHVQFEHFFPPELVAEVEKDSRLLEGRTAEVTILVSRLRDSAVLWQQLGAEPMCRLLRDLTERFSERIVEHGGVIVDYPEDGILAMWNAPIEQPDHGVRACQAALAMLDELPGLNARWGELAVEALEVGMGIHTGKAQVGSTGSSRKFKYGPFGRAVELARRVQNTTQKLGLPLLITGATREQLPAAFAVRRLGQLGWPGREERIMLYEVHGESASPEWLAMRDGYENALQFYEGEEWSRACLALLPLVQRAEHQGAADTPTLRLMRRASQCLETPPEAFDPVIELAAE
jgi:adenylate cyclase